MHVLPYANELIESFADAESEAARRLALVAVKSQFGQTYPMVMMVIGGHKIHTNAVITSTNPSAPSEVVGRAARATREHADAALESAWLAFETDVVTTLRTDNLPLQRQL